MPTRKSHRVGLSGFIIDERWTASGVTTQPIETVIAVLRLLSALKTTHPAGQPNSVQSRPSMEAT